MTSFSFRSRLLRRFTVGVLAAIGASVLAAGVLSGCTSDDGDTLTVYSGRTQSLVQPLLERYNEASGVRLRVRYGGTPELAATILEEGSNSAADVFFAQDAGSLGALDDEGMLVKLPDDILAMVPPAFRSPDGTWVGVSGRARVVAYNTDVVTPEDLPRSILEYTDPQWRGRIGWAPTNASFQAFVTGLRQLVGEDAARDWLLGIKANDPVEYPNNTTLVQGVANGEVDVGFTNHYYLYRFLEEQGEGFKARNFFFTGGDPGGLINVAGVGVLATSKNQEAAFDFVRYLLSESSQQYFAEETFEYPLVPGVAVSADLPPLESLEPPEIDLSDLDDLRGTIELLQETGVLP